VKDIAPERLRSVKMATLKLGTRGDAVLLDVHVVPRASKTAIVGLHDGRVRVALAAPPVDGVANAALLRFFADALALRLRDVTLVRGDKTRQKTLAIRGTDEATVRALCELGTSPQRHVSRDGGRTGAAGKRTC
jgi:uncharacterized protein